MVQAGQMRLRLLGPADTVTGPRPQVEVWQLLALAVCGLFARYMRLRTHNRKSFPVRARNIGAVLLSPPHLCTIRLEHVR